MILLNTGKHVNQKIMGHLYRVVNAIIGVKVCNDLDRRQVLQESAAQDLWIMAIIQSIGLIAQLKVSKNIIYQKAGKVVLRKVRILSLKLQFESS